MLIRKCIYLKKTFFFDHRKKDKIENFKRKIEEKENRKIEKDIREKKHYII